MAYPPVIFLAFANERTHPEAYLKELDRERNGLIDLLTPSEWCEVRARTEATIGRIEDIFAKYKSAIRIFHFSGHAGSTGIQVETKEGNNQQAFAKGLAGFIGKQKGVRLAFLNGCSTQEQVKAFHDAGIPAVIATKYPVKDNVASEFAQHFYRSLVSGCSLKEAFEEAEQKLLTPYPSAKELYSNRDWVGEVSDENILPHPYQFYIHSSQKEVGNERLKDWHNRYLSETSDKDPATHQESLNPNTYLLCNRTTASQTFERRIQHQLNQGAKQPQFFLIHGPDEEEPNSLTQRFVKYSIRELMELEKGRIRVRKPYLVDLPDVRDFSHEDEGMPLYQRDQYLRRGLKIRAKQINAREVIRQVGQKVDAAFIQHNIMADRWHNSLPAFIKQYMDEFWNVTLGPKDPRIIILFNVVYTRKDTWNRLLGRGDAKIEKALKALDSQVEAASLIQKLHPVPKSDVIKWRMKWLQGDGGWVDEMYRSSKALPMRKVQQELKYAIERHNDLLA